ncbi:hypothetical protein [Ensifer sp. BR816]|uniref:hypothetical protein n=1 Tax=Rhizobium sp. (strain BR816) TaxID=1057002 RepID=UPI0003639B47|nr:hypothetical protein [Ensifer sp. BR816]
MPISTTDLHWTFKVERLEAIPTARGLFYLKVSAVNYEKWLIKRFDNCAVTEFHHRRNAFLQECNASARMRL